MDRDNFSKFDVDSFDKTSDHDDDDNLDQVREQRRSKFDRKVAKMARRKEPRREKDRGFTRGGKEDRIYPDRSNSSRRY